MNILNRVLKKVAPTDKVLLTEELCGDEGAHGKNQAMVSLAELDQRLSQRTGEVSCYMVQCRGFWAEELTSIAGVASALSEDDRYATNIPLYVYVLHEGANYKVAVATRFIPWFFDKNYGYYTEVISDAGKMLTPYATSFVRGFYSSDLLSLLNAQQKEEPVYVYKLS